MNMVLQDTSIRHGFMGLSSGVPLKNRRALVNPRVNPPSTALSEPLQCRPTGKALRSKPHDKSELIGQFNPSRKSEFVLILCVKVSVKV
jgi:DNA-binding helix-hairpin-helix protein with protein kinase domain